MAGYPYLIVDVFTSEALAGNQLAVFTEGQAIPPERLQPLALEMGFSETVFVFPPAGDETARVRIGEEDPGGLVGDDSQEDQERRLNLKLKRPTSRG